MPHVLIPGAGGAAWLWHRVLPLLPDAVAVDLPGDDPDLGLDAYADLVVEAMRGRDDVVLVAQSMGAFTAGQVVARHAVGGLLFLNAMIPAPGEMPAEWWDAVGSEPARWQAAREGGWTTDMDLETYFLHDVPPEIAAAGAEHQREESQAAFGSACALESWPSVPIRVGAGADDRFFPLALQQRVARERLGVEAEALPGGHLNPLSRPEAVAAWILG